MPNVMHHVHRPPHVHHNASWYILVALTALLGVILILSLIPTITIPSITPINMAAVREGAYLDYLRGEKIMYTNPIELNNALVAYRAGEKILYDIHNATLAYHLGEKSATLDLKALNAEDALYIQRMGEKDYQPSFSR
ncbi:MAG: hypothetical protein OHK003_21930 [Anaerolineales bacterium]